MPPSMWCVQFVASGRLEISLLSVAFNHQISLGASTANTRVSPIPSSNCAIVALRKTFSPAASHPHKRDAYSEQSAHNGGFKCSVHQNVRMSQEVPNESNSQARQTGAANQRLTGHSIEPAKSDIAPAIVLRAAVIGIAVVLQ